MATEKRIKKCAKCGKAFECSHTADCWCNEYKISSAVLAQLRQRYADCLCPACLSSYSENKAGGIDN